MRRNDSWYLISINWLGSRRDMHLDGLAVDELGQRLFGVGKVLRRELFLADQGLPKADEAARMFGELAGGIGMGKFALEECVFPPGEGINRSFARDPRRTETHITVIA